MNIVGVLIKAFLAVVGFIALVAIASVLSGTILWLVWPVAMVEVFKLPALTWWQAVTLTWVCAILIKSSPSSSKG